MLAFDEPLQFNPLYIEGANGIPISIIGGVFSYYYFRYMKFPFLRIAITSSIFFMFWIAGVIYIGTNIHGFNNAVSSIIWTGILTVMYFMFIGAINGIFGYWISLINIYIAVHSILITHNTTPLVWVNVLGLIGIDNLYFQWFVVIVSSILGISEKGVEWITIPEKT